MCRAWSMVGSQIVAEIIMPAIVSELRISVVAPGPCVLLPPA